MRKVEIAFVLAVLGFAVVFSAMSLSYAARARAAATDAAPAPLGAAGRARDVDIEKVKRLIRQGYLSDREAKFYRKLPGLPANGTEPPARPASSRPAHRDP